MSFLDNLENDLKALENREEKDPEKMKRDQERREADRCAAMQRAPHVEALKHSTFTSELLKQCRAIGHKQRVLAKFTWIGESLRLDANEKRLELTPTAKGITAVFSVHGTETKREEVNPATDDAGALAGRWLTE